MDLFQNNDLQQLQNGNMRHHNQEQAQHALQDRSNALLGNYKQTIQNRKDTVTQLTEAKAAADENSAAFGGIAVGGKLKDLGTALQGIKDAPNRIAAATTGVLTKPSAEGSAANIKLAPNRGNAPDPNQAKNLSADAHNVTTVGEDGLGKTDSLLGKGGKILNNVKNGVMADPIKSVGMLGSVLSGGIALDSDFKGGKFHLSGDNDWAKASNAFQLGGAVLDTVGVVNPIADVVGLASDAISGVLGIIGDIDDEGKKSKLKTPPPAPPPVSTTLAAPTQSAAVSFGRTE